MALLSAELMSKAGIPVTLICGDSGEDCPLQDSEIEIIPIGCTPPDENSYHRHGATGLYNPRTKQVLDRFIAKRDTARTVYNLHNWTKLLSPSIFLPLRKVAHRTFASAHDYSLVCPNLSYSLYQKGGAPCPVKPLGLTCVLTNCDRRSYLHKLWRVARCIERRAFFDIAENGALLGVIHPAMVEYFTRGGVPAERLRVVRNVVAPYSDMRVEAETNSDLFFIGRVTYEKGVDLAAEAARLTGRRLRVIGDGEMRQRLSERYPEVIFEGWRTHEEIGRLIREARILLVPSRLPETFTLVAHQAMRSGVPVVTFTDVDCEEAAAMGAAVVVPPRSASNLADGILRLSDNGAVAKMSQQALLEGWRFSNTAETWRDAMLANFSDLLDSADA